MFFTPSQEWLTTTADWRYSRSDTLKKLDAAIASANQTYESESSFKRYNEALIDATPEYRAAAAKLSDALIEVAFKSVNQAFSAWAADQTRKGNPWRESARNASGAVTKLFDQLVYWRRIYPGEDVNGALQVLRLQRNNSIPALFVGCKCVLKSDDTSRLKDASAGFRATSSVYKIAKNARKLGATAATPGSGGSLGALRSCQTLIDGMVRSAFGTSLGSIDWGPSEVFIQKMLGDAISNIQEEIAALTPGAGLGVATATVLKTTFDLVKASIATDSMVDLSRKIEDGDSRAALQRVRDWQLLDIAMKTSKIARASVNVGLHSATIASCGASIPVQLALGIASAIVSLIEVIANLGMQYKESRALTSYLNGVTPLDRSIFAASPLVGAYYLLNTPTSHIALQLVELGAPAWREDVEHLVRSGELRTVITESERLISGSRYRIIGRNGVALAERLGKKTKVKVQEAVGMTPLRGKPGSSGG